MAEIKIEKKSPVWPWVLLALAVAAVIAYFVYINMEQDAFENEIKTEQMEDTDALNNNDTTNYDDANSDSNYNHLMEFDAAIKDSTRIGKDSTYTKYAMQKLINTVVMKAEQNDVEPITALTNLEDYAEFGTATTHEMNISKSLKSLSDDVISVIQSIQTKNFPNLKTNVSHLKESSNKLNNTTLLENQQKNLNDFFMKAKDVLNSMNQ